MENGEDSAVVNETTAPEMNEAVPTDAWLERRLRVFERALNALEQRQEKSERAQSLAIETLEERLGQGEFRLVEVETRFGKSHRAPEKSVDVDEQHIGQPSVPAPTRPDIGTAENPEVGDVVRSDDFVSGIGEQNELAFDPEPELDPAPIDAAVEMQTDNAPEKLAIKAEGAQDTEFLSLARQSALISAVSEAPAAPMRRVKSFTRPLLAGLAAIVVTLTATAFVLSHSPGSSAATAAVAGSGQATRHVVFDPQKRIEVLADAGNRRAMHTLAMQYAGRGDMSGAARWFVRAAEMGYRDSQFNLAVLYERGEGVRQSLVDAYVWYSIAAENNDSEAAKRVEAIQSQLAPAQLVMAEETIQSFKSKAPDETAEKTPLKVQG